MVNLSKVLAVASFSMVGVMGVVLALDNVAVWWVADVAMGTVFVSSGIYLLKRSGGHKDPTSWHQNTATVLHCQRSPVSRRPVSGENKTAAVEGLQTDIILRRGHPQETS